MPRRVVLGLLLMFAAIGLGACYASHRLLLDQDGAVHPFEDGVYVRDGGAERWRISLGLDGWYSVEDFNPNGTIGETRRVLFNELPLQGMKAFAIAEETGDGYDYAVALKQGDQVFLATPDCADPLDADLAADHGGRPQDDDSMGHACLFHDRDDLVSALAAFAGQADYGAPYRREQARP